MGCESVIGHWLIDDLEGLCIARLYTSKLHLQAKSAAGSFPKMDCLVFEKLKERSLLSKGVMRSGG